MCLIFVFRFAITVEYAFFFVYMNELLPTQIRVLGLNFVCGVGSFVVTTFPQIASFCIQVGLPLMAVFAILSGLSMWVSSMLD
jgi:branched-subunit amino acid transport protein AzlD